MANEIDFGSDSIRTDLPGHFSAVDEIRGVRDEAAGADLGNEVRVALTRELELETRELHHSGFAGVVDSS